MLSRVADSFCLAFRMAGDFGMQVKGSTSTSIIHEMRTKILSFFCQNCRNRPGYLSSIMSGVAFYGRRACIY